jgi:hypothetical protein
VNPRLPNGGTTAAKPRRLIPGRDLLLRWGARRKPRGPTRERGFVGPTVVLADRFDCRSRRAACGHERPGAMSVPEAAGSSPFSFGSGGRRSAGSRTGAAKSRDRWRVSRSRPVRASGSVERGTGRWKAPWAVLAVAFDEAAVKPVLAARAALRRTRVATGASKAVMFGPSTEDNAEDGGCHLAGSRRSGARQDRVASAPSRNTVRKVGDEGAREGWWPQLRACRQARRDPGCPLGLCSIGRGQRRESAAVTSGVEGSERCTCRVSVAEVGQEHLSRSKRGRRKALEPGGVA